MNANEELHIAYKIANQQINNFPFPHIYVNNIFTDAYYKEILGNLPDYSKLSLLEEKRKVTKGVYLERSVFTFDEESLKTLDDIKKNFWKQFNDRFLSGNIKNFLLSRFLPYIEQRFPNYHEMEFYDELLLVNDVINYKLGPHTDSKKKVLTFLFYLPKDELQKDLGTSIYFPKNPSFKCLGGPHYNHENFEKIITLPFLPNSLFCFVKTDNSFHGVEKINSNERRWLLLYDIFVNLPK